MYICIYRHTCTLYQNLKLDGAFAWDEDGEALNQCVFFVKACRKRKGAIMLAGIPLHHLSGNLVPKCLSV